jgi:hypothetical protein
MSSLADRVLFILFLLSCEERKRSTTFLEKEGASYHKGRYTIVLSASDEEQFMSASNGAEEKVVH